MALYDGFFDSAIIGTNEDGSPKYDREYGSGDFVGYFGQMIGSGVCISRNEDSFLGVFDDGQFFLRPGYLWISGYWLRNGPEKDEDPETYKGHPVDLPSGTGKVAIVAFLNTGTKMIEVETQEVSDEYPADTLVLCIVDLAERTVEDTRYNTKICGVIDSAGGLSNKVKYVLDYIDNEIDSKLEQIENDIANQEKRLDEKIKEVGAVVDKISPLPVGTIKFSAAQDMGEEWLRCDGRVVSREEYPDLVDALLNISGLETEFDGAGFYWEETTLPSSALWSSIAYGNGVFVTIANNDEVAYSTDGKTWTEATMPYSVPWTDVTYGNGIFVAVAGNNVNGSGSNKAAYSRDGKTWTGTTLPSFAASYSVTYGNGLFVAVSGSYGSDSNKAAYSTNGRAWLETTLPYSGFWYSVVYGGEMFVAVSDKGMAAYSADGKTWDYSMISRTTAEWRDITYGDGLFVAVSNSRTDAPTTSAYSSDGKTWTEITWTDDGSLSLGSRCITYGNGLFVTVALDSNKSAYSTDGKMWTETTLPSFANWCDIAYGNGLFVAISSINGKSAYTSPFDKVNLPVLSLSNIPAYIRAKKMEEEEI